MEVDNQSAPPNYRSLLTRLMVKLEQTEQRLRLHIDDKIDRDYPAKTASEQNKAKKELKHQVDLTLNAFFDHIIEEFEVYYLLDDNRVQRRETGNYIIESRYTPVAIHRYFPKRISTLVKNSMTLVDSKALLANPPDEGLMQEEEDEVFTSSEDDDDDSEDDSSVSSFGDEDDDDEDEVENRKNTNKSSRSPIITTVDFESYFPIKNELSDEDNDDDNVVHRVTKQSITPPPPSIFPHEYSDICICETCVNARAVAKIEKIIKDNDAILKQQPMNLSTGTLKVDNDNVKEEGELSDDDDEIAESNTKRKEPDSDGSVLSTKRTKRSSVSDDPEQKMLTLHINCLDPTCDVVFADRKLLFKHALNYHAIKPHKCYARDCGLEFESTKLLNTHTRLFHDPTSVQYICDKCEAQVELRSSSCFDVHWRRFHELGSYKCATTSECNFVATIREDVTRHQRKAHKMFQCTAAPNCTAAFSISADLKKHEARHAAKKISLPMAQL